MAVRYFTWSSFFVRLLMTAVLVLLTYNPTEFSYIHWLMRAFENDTLGAPHAFAGVVVAIGWVILLRATFRSLGGVGLFLGAAFFGTLVWFLISVDILNLQDPRRIAWVALACLAGLLAVGLSWSHIRRRLSGQVDVDDVDVA
ncbi:MAG TPA: DUF6524 family protein [Gammaproteobacteria bacterium]